MAYDHTTIENTDMNHTQPTPSVQQGELVVQILSPVILPTGIVGNILIIWILLRTRSRFASFANYFTTLAVTDLLLLLLLLLPRYVESYVRARFDVDGHLICRLYSFMYYFLLTSSSLLLAAVTSQRAAGVVWPHRVKTTGSDSFSCIALCIIFVAAALLKCQALIKGQLLYKDCYLGSERLAHVGKSLQGYATAWGHFLTVFMLPFSVILVSNYLLISGVNSSKRVTRIRVGGVSQRDTAFSSGKQSLLRRSWRRMVGYLRSMNSITVIVVVTSLFFCSCLMPRFLIKVLILGKMVDPRSISNVIFDVLDMLVYLNASSKFYLYCINGRGFRQELRRICRGLLCGRLAAIYRKQKISMTPVSRPTSFTSSGRPSPTPTPRTTMTNFKLDLSPGASQRQLSPHAVRHEKQSLSSNGPAEPKRTPEPEITLPHPCEKSSESMPSTRPPSTAADTPLQTGETVPSEQHVENVLESGTTLPHPCKTSPEPMPSTRPPNMAADTPIQAGETVPSEQHLQSLPSSGGGVEAEDTVTEPGKIMALITVLKTNSRDLSHGQDRHLQSIEEDSLAASVQGKFHWA